MPIRPVLEYPEPILRQPCKALSPDEIHSAEIQQLITDMTETLYNHEGAVGLAAPQVGASVNIVLMDSTAKTTKDRRLVLINPEISAQSRWKFGREGCLSFPEYLITVKRARKLTLTWLDEHAQPHEETFLDFEAVIIQHEMDHLAGILFIDRMQNAQTDLLLRPKVPENQA